VRLDLVEVHGAGKPLLNLAGEAMPTFAKPIDHKAWEPNSNLFGLDKGSRAPPFGWFFLHDI